MKDCPACGFQAPKGVTAASPAYHRAHRDAHLKKFPNVDARTREALEDLIARAERREIVQRARVS